MSRTHALAPIFCFVSCSVSAVCPPAGDTPLSTIRVASELDRPLFVTHAPGDFERIFIVEQRGRIKILKGGVVLDTPFLDIEANVSCCSEQGLLGLAFHPDYAGNGRFFIDYTNQVGDTVIVRHNVSAEPDVADRNGELVLKVPQPDRFHNGGWIEFGPDGFLYIALGDGGGHNDPENRAQDPNQLLGKLLRIDVNGDDFPDDPDRNYAIPPDNPFVGIPVAGEDEIWALGLRNPWRCAFDAETGDLYITDVGERSWEEINFQAAQSGGGQNYGWRCMEGAHCSKFGGCDCSSPSLVPPIHEYDHGDPGARCSIIGGQVYRGCAIADLRGTYFFADYCSNQIWSFRFNKKVSEFRDRTVELTPVGKMSIQSISSFGRDAYGELYICDLQDGEVFKIVAEGGPPQDCNKNGTEDSCDLLDGSSVDTNGNAIPDECEAGIWIIESVPSDGAIDARQPWAVDGKDPAGWQTVELTFSGNVARLGPKDFAVTQVGGMEPAPEVCTVTPLGENITSVTLDRRIDQCAWTTITHKDSGSGVRIGYLPGDVNADGTRNSEDVLALIAALQGELKRPIWSTDIDRSGTEEPGDLLRTIDILNGAGAYRHLPCVNLPPPQPVTTSTRFTRPISRSP